MKLFGSSSSKHRKVSSSSKKKTVREENPYADESYIYAEENSAYSNAEPAPTPALKRSGKRRKKKRGKTALVVLLIIALLIGGTAVGIAIWMRPPEIEQDGLKIFTTPKVQTSDNPEVTDDGSGVEEELVARNLNAERKKGVYTFLITCWEPGDAAGNIQNTDVIMLGMLDTVNGEFNVVNIPRDTMMNNGVSNNKRINCIYSVYGGADPLMDYVSEILGYRVDFYAVVYKDAFIDVIDTIGGVWYDVPRDMYSAKNNIDIKAGYQWLSGEDAFKVVWFRTGDNGTGYAEGDIGRIGTQQDFIMSVMKQMISLKNIPNLSKVLDIVSNNVETNLSYGNIAWLAKEFLKLKSEDIHFDIIPAEYYGHPMVSIKIDEWVNMINEKLNPFKDTLITADNLNILYYDANGNMQATTGIIR